MQDAFLMREEAVPEAGAIGHECALGTREASLILLRHDGRIRAYLNSCPHTGVRLEWRSHEFFDADGRYLQCATHGALFEPGTGQCVSGPCRGHTLLSAAVSVRQGEVWLTAPATLPNSAKVRR